MPESFDRDKVVEYMFDPITSGLISALEGGPKESRYLAEQSSISENEVKERFSYLIEHGFISQKSENNKIVFEANTEKLTEIVEHGDNFDDAIDGLTKMDSYLN